MRVLLVMVLVVMVQVERAEACSCYASPIVVPADGATVPTNVLLVVEGTTPTLLRTSTGATVPFDRVALGTDLSKIEPRTPLAPNTTYMLDTPESFPPGHVTFTTTADRDDTAPAAAVLRSMTPQVMDYPGDGCASTCVTTSGRDGWISRIGFDHELSGDAAMSVVEVRKQGETAVTLTRFDGFLGFDRCTPRAPILDPDASYCARIVTYDVAGNTSTSDEVCNTTARCASDVSELNAPEGSCEPSKACKPVSSSGCNAGGGGAGWLVVLALSRGWSRRFARRRPLRAQPPAP